MSLSAAPYLILAPAKKGSSEMQYQPRKFWPHNLIQKYKFKEWIPHANSRIEKIKEISGAGSDEQLLAKMETIKAWR